MTLRAAILFSIVCLAAFPAGATEPSGTCPERPSDEESARAWASRFFDEGQKQYEAGHLIEALKSFLCSMRMSPHENTVFNISHIADASPNKKRVRALLDNYLAEGSQGKAVDSLAKIKRDLDSSIDSTEPAPLDPSQQADPGSSSYESSLSADAPTRPLRVTSWVLMGAGAAGLVAGGILQAGAGASQSNGEKADSFDQFSREKDKMDTLQTGALIGFIAGGVLAGTGLVFYIISNGEEENTDLSVSLIPSGRGLMLQGRF